LTSWPDRGGRFGFGGCGLQVGKSQRTLRLALERRTVAIRGKVFQEIAVLVGGPRQTSDRLGSDCVILPVVFGNFL